MPAFSNESLTRITLALSQCPRRNPYYHHELTRDGLSASFGYGEGIRMWREDGKYICLQHRERSTFVDTFDDEEAAVERFIRLCGAGMASC